jgi:hypothetical protein
MFFQNTGIPLTSPYGIKTQKTTIDIKLAFIQWQLFWILSPVIIVDFRCIFTIIPKCFKQQGVIAAQIQMKCCRWSLATHTAVMVTAGWPSPGSRATHCFHLKGSTQQQVLLQRSILVRSHVCNILSTFVASGGNRSMHLKMAVFWDVVSYSLVDTDQRFRGAYCLHYQDELSDYMAQHPRRQPSLYLLSQEPEISPSM